jgi:hypothetical protein
MTRFPAAFLLALALGACSFYTPGGNPAPKKLEALPPPQDIGEDEAPAPPAREAAPLAESPGLIAPPPPGFEGKPLAEPAGPSLDWRTALEGDAVTVTITDATSHYRVEQIELLGPGGVRLPAGPLERQVERRYGYTTETPPGTFALGVFGGSSSGVGLGMGANKPLGIHDSNAPPRTTTRARIALPDPAAYRRDAGAWKLAVQLIDLQGADSLVEIPAPRP